MPSMGMDARVEQVVAEMILEVAPEVGSSPGPDDVLADLGLDSLAVADLAIAVEERFGIRLADGDPATLRTVGEVASLIRRRPPSGRRIPFGLGAIQRPIERFPGGLIRWFFRMEVSGAGHVPASGPVVLPANHRSMWDVPIHVLATPRPVQFMAKQELYRPPFPAIWWSSLGGFSVRREIADLRAIDVALAVLERGEVLGIYPEGKRSREGHMLPFLRGAAWLALRTGTPIVPTAIMGTARNGPAGRRPLRRRVRIAFGSPTPVEREDDPVTRRKKAEVLTDELRAAIASLIDE
jgi:1-acyl-sn-glycerol-3-phosphate acyltransferase